MTKLPAEPPLKLLVGSQKQFAEWSALNDTIMGGTSNGECRSSKEGLIFDGEIIEQGGGFVSCRSNIFSPPLNLSMYKGLQIDVEGSGRTLKIGLSCQNNSSFIMEKLLPSGLKWVASIPTEENGLTSFRIPFNSLEPSLRAKPVYMPIQFNSSSVNQFQILHSKFGQPGKLNYGFRSGLFTIILRSIYAYF
tara:strand:- start:196 stop:771 length:576 start_codon:yes stop_codon:yes gene_type:complete